MTKRQTPILLPPVAIHAKPSPMGAVRLVKAYDFNGPEADTLPTSLTYQLRDHPELIPWANILVEAQAQIVAYAERNRP